MDYVTLFHPPGFGDNNVLKSDFETEEEAMTFAGEMVESGQGDWAEVFILENGERRKLHRFDREKFDFSIWGEDKATRRRQIAKLIQRLQNEILKLRDEFRQDDPEFYAITLVWQALRVAWYVIDKSKGGGIASDDGKLENLEDAVKDLNFALEHDRGGRE